MRRRSELAGFQHRSGSHFPSPGLPKRFQDCWNSEFIPGFDAGAAAREPEFPPRAADSIFTGDPLSPAATWTVPRLPSLTGLSRRGVVTGLAQPGLQQPRDQLTTFLPPLLQLLGIEHPEAHKSQAADQRFKRRRVPCWYHWRMFRVRPLRKKRAAAGRRHRQAACNRARPNGYLESLAVLMALGFARCQFGAPVEAVFSSCVLLSVVSYSVVAFLVETRATRYAAVWLLAMGCSPHAPIQAIVW